VTNITIFNYSGLLWKCMLFTTEGILFLQNKMIITTIKFASSVYFSGYEYWPIYLQCFIYDGCPENIPPFWISREPVAWPWCNLAASQRRPQCASVNSHSPVGLVSRQWDAVDWACVLCDCRIHKSPPFQRRFQLWEKSEVAGSQIWTVGGADRPGLCDVLPKKACTRAVEWAGALS